MSENWLDQKNIKKKYDTLIDFPKSKIKIQKK